MELIVYGQDFYEALEYCQALAEQRGLQFMPSIDGDLISGVPTYALEFFRGAPALDRIYVPIGLGQVSTALSQPNVDLAVDLA